MVMFHPIGLRRQFWEGPARELEADYRILSLDIPGHGESDVSAGPQSIVDMAAAAGELVEALGGDRLILIGCSMGSSIAATLAARMPDRVTALVLSSSTYDWNPERHRAMSQRASQARRGMAAMIDQTIERWFSPATLGSQSDLVSMVTEWLLAGDPVVHARCWEALRDFDYQPIIPRLGMPTLVIRGECDPAARPSAVRALAGALTNAEYDEVAEAGHLVPAQRPREFVTVVREFLDRRV